MILLTKIHHEARLQFKLVYMLPLTRPSICADITHKCPHYVHLYPKMSWSPKGITTRPAEFDRYEILATMTVLIVMFKMPHKLVWPIIDRHPSEFNQVRFGHKLPPSKCQLFTWQDDLKQATWLCVPFGNVTLDCQSHLRFICQLPILQSQWQGWFYSKFHSMHVYTMIYFDKVPYKNYGIL